MGRYFKIGILMDLSHLRSGDRLAVGLGYSEIVPSMDFETYSEAGFVLDHQAGTVRGIAADGKGGLPVVGTPVYAEHPSTDVICLYYDLKEGLGRRPWMPGLPDPYDLLDHVRAGGLMEAWNVGFEWWIWNMVCVRKYGWPPLAIEQCRCAMAKSRRNSTPGGLDNAAKVLGTAQKHKEGKQLVTNLTRPHKWTKKRQFFRRDASNSWDEISRLYAYCDGDVLAEDEASARLPDLTPYEFATWQTDMAINARGIQVDVSGLDSCLTILALAEERYTSELVALTKGQVSSVNERDRFLEWMASLDYTLPDMQKATIDKALKEFERADAMLAGTLEGISPSERHRLLHAADTPDEVRRALKIRQLLGAANVKKLRTLKLQLNSDGRLRDQYSYCGADRTGRWSAGGVQLQNITAKGPKTARCGGCGGFHVELQSKCPRCEQWVDIEPMPDWGIEQVEMALWDISHNDLDRIEKIYGDPVAVLCGVLRGLFTAREGHDLICVDFSAIEAVVLACLSRCQWRIDVFSTHGKIYEQSAANATGIPFEEILDYKRQHGQSHPARKTIGKVRELAGGYGGWIGAWKNFGADKFMTDEEIKEDVLKWRAESPEIVEFWGGQYRETFPGSWEFYPERFGLEGAAINAIEQPGVWFPVHDIAYGVHDDILYCRLPSGRTLRYHRPRLVPDIDRRSKRQCWKITFEGWNSNAMKGPVGWHRMETYGGRLAENVTQATAADIQAEALVRLEARGYPVVLHTHDEAACEMPIGVGSIEQQVEIMQERPVWAPWWPIRADGWRGPIYRKD